MSIDLTGKSALVTGAGSGIGRATAIVLARYGARVAVAGRRPDALEQTVALVAAVGGEALAVPTDVSVPDEVEAMVAATVQAFGTLEIACNNAAIIGTEGPITSLSADDFDHTMGTNLRGAFLCLKHELAAMTGPGAIVNVSSVNATLPERGASLYCTSKAGLDMLTQVAALEAAAHGVRVNSRGCARTTRATSPGRCSPSTAGSLSRPPDESARNCGPFTLGRPSWWRGSITSPGRGAHLVTRRCREPGGPTLARPETLESVGRGSILGVGERTTMDLDPTKKNCSFCGDPGRHDKPLVGGLGAFMCGDCVDYYAGVAAAERCKEPAGPPPWESMSDADILGKLSLILQNGAQVDRFLAEWVLLARSRKLSWAEIGKAMGISRQAAWERFARDEAEAGTKPGRALGSA